jgi:hypothetical protein
LDLLQGGNGGLQSSVNFASRGGRCNSGNRNQGRGHGPPGHARGNGGRGRGTSNPSG